jgi:hypothetical protein
MCNRRDEKGTYTYRVQEMQEKFYFEGKISNPSCPVTILAICLIFAFRLRVILRLLSPLPAPAFRVPSFLIRTHRIAARSIPIHSLISSSTNILLQRCSASSSHPRIISRIDRLLLLLPLPLSLLLLLLSSERRQRRIRIMSKRYPGIPRRRVHVKRQKRRSSGLRTLLGAFLRLLPRSEGRRIEVLIVTAFVRWRTALWRRSENGGVMSGGGWVLRLGLRLSMGLGWYPVRVGWRERCWRKVSGLTERR